jgi:hypothetical protein
MMISFSKAERCFSTRQYTSEKEQGGILNFNLLDYRGQYVGFATFKRNDLSSKEILHKHYFGEISLFFDSQTKTLQCMNTFYITESELKKY